MKEKLDSSILEYKLNKRNSKEKLYIKVYKGFKYNLTFKETQKKIIDSISKNPENIILQYSKVTPKNFDEYKESLDNSLSNYQLTYEPRYEDQNQDFRSPNQKYLTKTDRLLIRQVSRSNRNFYLRGLAPINEDSNLKIMINPKKYPNPYESLGVIKHNYLIFDEMNRDFLDRQGCLFKQKIVNIQNYKNKFGSKMPKIHISKSSKIPFEIPVVDMTEEKDKKDFSSLPNLSKSQNNGSLKLFAYYRYPNKNFPEGREQFSIFYDFKDIKLYICGGLSISSSGLINWCLDLEKLEWEKIPQKEFTYNRFGHTAILYQNKIYMYGGRTKVKNGFTYQGFEVFSMKDGIYFSPNINKTNSPPQIRNHIAELIANQILIYGGITENNEILNDCYLLNLSPLKWLKVNINIMTPGPKLYGHTSSLVVPKQFLLNRKFNIYSYPDIEILNCRIKQKGLYIFGGKSKEESGISNKLWILILGQKNLEWVLPETSGKPPRPRYHHSMSFYERGNYLIIHGGKNDSMSDNGAFDDTFVFDLELFEWHQVELYSQLTQFKILCRFGHQSAIYHNKLIIFGGMNSCNYIGSSLLIVNLDFSYSNDQKSIQEIMLRELKDKTDPEAKKKMVKLRNELRRLQTGIVTSINSINLPSIK